MINLVILFCVYLRSYIRKKQKYHAESTHIENTWYIHVDWNLKLKFQSKNCSIQDAKRQESPISDKQPAAVADPDEGEEPFLEGSTSAFRMNQISIFAITSAKNSFNLLIDIFYSYLKF